MGGPWGDSESAWAPPGAPFCWPEFPPGNQWSRTASQPLHSPPAATSSVQQSAGSLWAGWGEGAGADLLAAPGG